MRFFPLLMLTVTLIVGCNKYQYSEADPVPKSGLVIIDLVINEQGKPESYTTRRAPHPAFEEAIREAIKRWEFKPTLENGRAVKARKRVEIELKRDSSNSLLSIKKEV